MIIVVEGPNNAGKTTFINKLKEKLPNFKVIHTDANTPNTYDYYIECLNKKEDIIYDRLFIGEMIYPILYNRTGKLDRYKYHDLCNTFSNVIYVFVDADFDFKKMGFIKKKETLPNMTEIESESAMFKFYEDELFNKGCNVYKLYNSSLYFATSNIIADNIINAISHKYVKETSFSKGYIDDAGTDIILKKAVTFEPKTISVIDLEVTVIPKENTMSFLVSRTSAAILGIHVESCPIDPNYCGTINAIVYNFSDSEVSFDVGEAFCQIVTVPTLQTNCTFTVRKQGKRSDGKFGSTNKE